MREKQFYHYPDMQANYPDQLKLEINVPVTRKNPYQIGIFRNSSVNQRKISVFYSLNVLELIENGTKKILRSNCETSAGPDDLLIIPAGSAKIEESAGFSGTYIFFNTGFIGNFIHSFFSGSVPKGETCEIFKCTASEDFRTSFSRSLNEIFAEKKYYPCMCRNHLQQFFLSLLHHDLNNRFRFFLYDCSRRQPPDLEMLLRRNLFRHLTNRQLAVLCGKSLSVFNREITARFGMPPQKWIIDQRLEYARELLAASDMNITEISFSSGFRNSAHFSRSFSEKFGKTPRQVKMEFSDKK